MQKFIKLFLVGNVKRPEFLNLKKWDFVLRWKHWLGTWTENVFEVGIVVGPDTNVETQVVLSYHEGMVGLDSLLPL